MSFLKPDAPTPPNPLDTARAQTGTNVSTAVANAYLGNINQNTPYGSLTYNQTGNYGWTDPTTNQTYQIPTFTATQTLSPQGQAIESQKEATQYNLAGMANAQSQRIAGLLSQNMDTSGAPAAGDPNAILNAPQSQLSYNAGGPIQSSIGPVGDITQSYGGDISAFQQQVQDSLMQRMNPQLDIQRQQLQQSLADQGIRYGSDAYNNAMLTYNQQANDARWGAIQQGVQAGSTMLGEMGAQAAFQNAAQQQGYEQSLGMGQFANQAQQQQYNQNAQLASFYNTAAQQQLAQQQSGFNAANAARNQWMQEQYAARNQPINEITSLLSGSQVNQPNFVNTPGSQIATTDIAGLLNQQFNQQMSVYQQQNNNVNSLVGGVLGLGAGALKASDKRVKKDIDRIGTVFAAGDDDDIHKLPIYRYSYKQDPASVRHVGPMAQDVEKVNRRAVRSVRGVKHIDTRKVMGSILRAA